MNASTVNYAPAVPRCRLCGYQRPTTDGVCATCRNCGCPPCRPVGQVPLPRVTTDTTHRGLNRE